MTDLFLGVIAVSVLVMAVIQVAAIVMTARMARRVDRVAGRVEQDVDRLFTRLHGLTDDAVGAASAFGGILGIFRKSRGSGGKPSGAPADPDDATFIG